MPCYTSEPTESGIIYDRITVPLLSFDKENRSIGFVYIKELVDAYVAMHAERNRMGNILCDLGKQFKHNAEGDIWPKPDFFNWLEMHEKRDKEKGNSLPPPESLFSFDPDYIQMGE